MPEYPIWCAEPNCGIDDCVECPFSPWNLRQKQIELEKKFKHCIEWIDGNGDEILMNIQEVTSLKERIEKIEKDVHRNWNLNQELAQEILPNYVEQEINELKEDINYFKGKKHVWARERNDIREVLREFNEALLGKNIIGVLFYNDMKKKLEKDKDGETSTPSKIHWFLEECDNYFKDQEQCAQGYKPFQCNTDCYYYMPKFVGSGVLGQSVPRNIMKEPTDLAGSARQTELSEPFDLRKFIEFALENAKVELPNKEQINKYKLVLKADLEFLFKYGDGNYEPCGHDDDDFFDLKEKYLEEKK